MADNKTLPLLRLQFLLLLLLPISAQTDTITPTSPLHDPDTILSPGRVFKLGFFTPQNTTNRYLAIFYAESEQTAIWIANRATPLSYTASASARISAEGNLVISIGRKRSRIIWSTGVVSSSSSPMNTTAQILDSGNLILTEYSTKRVLWDSFSHPLNIYVPTMKITDNINTGKKVLLSSWRNESDPAPGTLTTGLEVGTFMQVFTRVNGRPHFRSGPWNGGIFTGIEDMYVGYNFWTIREEPHGNFQIFLPPKKLLLKLDLNVSGHLTETIWNDQSQSWDAVWSAPKTDCDLYGKCGEFGVCNRMDSPICSCMEGFEPKNGEEWKRENWSSGCVRRKPLNCLEKGEGFLKLGFVKTPEFAESTRVGNEEECRNECLRNCSCIAYVYNPMIGGGCMLWREPLIDVQRFSGVGDALYLRLSASQLRELNHHKEKKLHIIIIAVVVPFVLLLICIFIGLWCWMLKRKGIKYAENETNDKSFAFSSDEVAIVVNDNTKKVSMKELPIFTYEMLQNATNGFHCTNMLGKGGFGVVYKGKLDNGKEIAVKRLSAASGQGMQEFMNEVILISKLQHSNLVKLLGCCVEKDEKMLIYEYMANKSLNLYLFDGDRTSCEILDWKKRLSIIEGIGRGLLYLHKDSILKIIHRDLKPSNVLLDEDMNPKISDFGMARIFGGNQDQANTTKIVGTYGYMAPEYAMEGIFSEKTDVYSFGVLVLEIISGKKNTTYYNHEWSLSLLGCAWKLWNEGNGIDFADETTESCKFEVQILRCIHIALLCVQEFPNDRPFIQTVLSMLDSEITQLPLPNKPIFAEKGVHFQVGPSQSTDPTLSVIEGR